MLSPTVRRLRQVDLRWALAVNRSAGRATVRGLRRISHLGDGPLWVAGALVLTLLQGPEAGARWLGALTTGAVLYHFAKRWTARPRPCDVSREIRRYGSPLDRYSFPSGHTLHAVSSAVVLEALVPGSNLVSWPLAVLIGVSRVVLGLHYPSDVLAGATLGLAIGSTWVWLDLAA